MTIVTLHGFVTFRRFALKSLEVKSFEVVVEYGCLSTVATTTRTDSRNSRREKYLYLNLVNALNFVI